MMPDPEQQNPTRRQNHDLGVPAIDMMIYPEEPLFSSAAPDLSVDEALAFMGSMNIDVLVVASEINELLGLVSRGDLPGGFAGGSVRDREIVLRDVMRPASVLYTLKLTDIDNTTTRDLLAALSDLLEQHVIVVAKESMEIRGLYSAADMARRIGLSPNAASRSDSFADLARYLGVQISAR